MNRSAAVIGLVALAAFGVGIFAGVLRNQPDTLSSAFVFPLPRGLPTVHLSDDQGQPLGSERFLNHWDIVFFGFTHCPDICPTTLYQLSQLRAELADLTPDRQPRIWLVSVDPQRDTPPVLARYLSHFGGAFSGITGSADQIAQFAAGFSVAYQHGPTDGTDYTVSHSAALFLVDPGAKLVGLFSAPHDMDKIADDYRILTR